MDNETISQTGEASLREYTDILRRRKAIILQTFVVVFVVGILISAVTKPLFRSETRILVEGKSMIVSSLETNSPLSDLFTGNAGHDVETQIEVLQGDNVMNDTYKAAGIPEDPPVTLDVKQSGNTDVIDIAVQSNDKQSAVKFAKTLPIVYRKYETGNRQNEIMKALDFSANQLKKEQQDLAVAEKALENFRTKNRLTDLETERTSRITKKVTNETDLLKALATMSGDQARLRVLELQRMKLPLIVEQHTTATNPAVQSLKEQIENQNTELERLSPIYKPTAVPMKQILEQIKDLKRRLKDTPALVTSITRVANPQLSDIDAKIGQAKTDYAEAEQQYKRTQKGVSIDEGILSNYSMLQREQSKLERDVARHDTSVSTLQKYVDDLSLRVQANHDPVVVISPPNDEPDLVAPRYLNNLLVASLIGIVLGLCFALLQEFLDDRINTPEEARRVFGVPALGYIPMIDGQETLLLERGHGGSLLETYRVLRSNIGFSAVDAPIQSILVTSTVPGEGKSTTAVNIAVAMAMDGRDVILVDADLRRPTLHKKCGLDRVPGVTNVLVNHMPLEEALQTTRLTNLKVLTAGPIPPNPAELLNSQSMARLHSQLKEVCDIVIFDSPPCLATADAQLLSASVDGVLYVAQFGETKKSMMRRAAELLQQAHARVLGVVFNKIDLKSNRDSYYYGYYNQYNYDDASGAILPDDKTQPRRAYREYEALLQAGVKNGRPSAAGEPNTTTDTVISEREE